MEKAYPTDREGMPVSVQEIWLPESNLDPELDRSYNIHHYMFNRRRYEADDIFNSLRNLETMQERMLKDQHNMGKIALHSLYREPKPPSHKQAMDRLEKAYDDGDKFNIKGDNGYELHEFTDKHWQYLKRVYNHGKV